MNKQRKVVITTTYNEMGIIIDTKAEEVAQPEIIRCRDCAHRIGTYCTFKYSYGTYIHDDDFCSNAERGEDAGI